VGEDDFTGEPGVEGAHFVPSLSLGRETPLKAGDPLTKKCRGMLYCQDKCPLAKKDYHGETLLPRKTANLVGRECRGGKEVLREVS